MKKINVTEIAAFLIVILFTYTATSKLLDYKLFIFQLTVAPIPHIKAIAQFVGVLVVAAEILIVAALLSPKFRIKGLYASLLLLICFELYIVTMLLSGLRLPCSCGGIVSSLSWKQHILFNGIFIILSIAGITRYKKSIIIKNGLNNSHNIKDLSRAQ